tara:strand:- start:167 stop:499 length:333 start_codon:yes stop_codon:yes gene_type:complete
MPLYSNDPNNTKKQVPAVTPNGIHRFSYAVCPSAEGITKRPSYVIINQPGSYAFAYESGSVSTYITASVIAGDADRGNPAVKLDINPVAWRQADAAGDVGDVTFVYVRVS